MHTPLQTLQLTPRPWIPTELVRLDRHELGLSQRRRRLHDEIDRLYLRAALDDEETTLLSELEGIEQKTSEERRVLHRRIDEVRAELGLPDWRQRHNELVA